MACPERPRPTGYRVTSTLATMLAAQKLKRRKTTTNCAYRKRSISCPSNSKVRAKSLRTITPTLLIHSALSHYSVLSMLLLCFNSHHGGTAAPRDGQMRAPSTHNMKMLCLSSGAFTYYYNNWNDVFFLNCLENLQQRCSVDSPLFKT